MTDTPDANTSATPPDNAFQEMLRQARQELDLEQPEDRTQLKEMLAQTRSWLEEGEAAQQELQGMLRAYRQQHHEELVEEVLEQRGLKELFEDIRAFERKVIDVLEQLVEHPVLEQEGQTLEEEMQQKIRELTQDLESLRQDMTKAWDGTKTGRYSLPHKEMERLQKRITELLENMGTEPTMKERIREAVLAEGTPQTDQQRTELLIKQLFRIRSFSTLRLPLTRHLPDDLEDQFLNQPEELTELRDRYRTHQWGQRAAALRDAKEAGTSSPTR